MDREILIVDDDARLLDAFRRRLGRKYYVTTVLCAGECDADDDALYAIIVASGLDVRPASGVRLLGKLKRSRPETLRILVADDAMPDDGEAEVFQCLAKPCCFEDIVCSIEAAFEPGKLRVTTKPDGFGWEIECD